MKKIITVLLLLLFLVMVKIIFSIPRNHWGDYLKIPDFTQWYPPDELTPPIYGEKSIRQDFRTNFDGLTEIGLPFVWENEPASISINLYKGEHQKHLVFKNGFLLTDSHKGKMFRFRFKPIVPSKDEYFSLVIKSPKATAHNNLRLYYSRRAFHISCQGPLYFDDQMVKGEIALIANCRYDIRKGIFTWAGEKIKKDKLFFLCYGVILLGIAGFAVFCHLYNKK